MTPATDFDELFHVILISLSSPNNLVCFFIKWVAWDGKNVEILSCKKPLSATDDMFPVPVHYGGA